MTFILSGSWSPPAQGAWIEIRKYETDVFDWITSPPAQGAWIEI